MKKFTTIWECPACKQRLTTHIELRDAPLCTRHTGGGRTMIEIGKK